MFEELLKEQAVTPDRCRINAAARTARLQEYLVEIAQATGVPPGQARMASG
jgi:hypothetical protein